jgi:protein O-GlcNAc transferase
MSAPGRSEQTLAAAMAHHRAGRLTDAERLYRIVCDTDPNNARAFHLLGVVAHQLRRPDAASYLGRAVTLDPDIAEAIWRGSHQSRAGITIARTPRRSGGAI